MTKKNPYAIWTVVLVSFIFTLWVNIAFRYYSEHAFYFSWTLMMIPVIVVIRYYPTWTYFIGSFVVTKCIAYMVESQIHPVLTEEHLFLFLTSSLVNAGIVGVVFFYRRKHQELVEQLEGLILEDPLTGIPNRRALDVYLDNAMPLIKAHQHETQILMMDVDHFKSINDTYGHVFGDRVLKDVSTIVRHVIRESDYVARYGGEEFTIVLPETSKEAGRMVAERIRQKVEHSVFRYNGVRVSVTVSIGMAEYDFTTTIKQWISEADEALYEAKDAGRNQIMVY